MERTDKETIRYIHEPTDLQCGQAVLAMLTGMTAEAVCAELGNERETTLREMKDYLCDHGMRMSDQRIQVNTREELPALLQVHLLQPSFLYYSLDSSINM